MSKFKKYKKPERTEVYISTGFNKMSEISILGETAKAYLIAYTKYIPQGYTKPAKANEYTYWIPKSIWDNDKWFYTDYTNTMFFTIPEFCY